MDDSPSNNPRDGDHALTELIHTLDTAFSEMTSFAVSAAYDADEARRNARIAAEMAKKYQSTLKSPKQQPQNFFNFAQSPNHRNQTPSPSPSRRPPPPPPKNTVNGQSLRDSSPKTRASIDGKNGSSDAQRIPSSPSRLAEAHAEDVLALSLELERTKNALEAEQTAHDETRSTLDQSKAKQERLEAQMDKLLNDMETQREEKGRQMDLLQEELERAKLRLQAADEDAQLALDLARSNSDSREQVEVWLYRALQEIEHLRSQFHTGEFPSSSSSLLKGQNGDSSPKVVRFADTPSFFTNMSDDETSASRPSRSLVAAGRQLLNRQLASPGSYTNSPSFSSPHHSAERRNYLRERLRSLDLSVDITSPSSVLTHESALKAVSVPICSEEINRRTSQTLLESGRRLNLSGRWWSANAEAHREDIQLDLLAKHYCTAVEVSFSCMIVL